MSAEPRERPILFSTAMVQAILAGNKTETRRVVIPRFAHIPGSLEPDGEGGITVVSSFSGCAPSVPCPYGDSGDLLYVRETFAMLTNGGDCEELTGPPSSLRSLHPLIYYRASDKLADSDAETRGYRWRPGIHLPKWASRIWLRVEEVRVERLQEITEEGALAEGIESDWSGAINCFWGLWDSINAKRGYQWSKNPWVWVVRFSVASSTGKPA